MKRITRRGILVDAVPNHNIPSKRCKRKYHDIERIEYVENKENIKKEEPRTPSKRTRILSLTPESAKRFRKPPSSSPLLKTPQSQIKHQIETPPSTPTVYSVAKALFQRGAKYTTILGRDHERKQLESFFKQRTSKRGNGALYLSGVPGAGKTALLNEVIDTIVKESKQEIRVAVINCMIVDRAEMIYARIFRELTEGTKIRRNQLKNDAMEISGVKMIKNLESLFFDKSSKVSNIVVLDELDHVITKNQDVLFQIFQLAFAKQSNLILVGIANALDLTDRFLPRLRANNLTPQVLAFSPYSSEEIAKIIEGKLRSLNPAPDVTTVPLMHPAAIQLCARKTAANTGDLRKSFDICRRAIELVEEEVRRKHYTQIESELEQHQPDRYKNAIVNGSKATLLTNLSIENAPKVMVMHIAKICSVAFGNSSLNRIKSLNLQQKTVLSILILYEKQQQEQMLSNNIASFAPTLGKLFQRYSELHGENQLLGKLQYGEFVEIINTLEFQGVVNVSSAHGIRRGGAVINDNQKKISSSVHLMDLITGISDVELLRKFVIDRN